MKIESAEKEFKKMVMLKTKEIQVEVDKKLLLTKRIYILIEFSLTIIGYGIICYKSSYLLAVGVWLAMGSNSMGLTRMLFKESNIWKQIWKNQ